MKFLQNILDSIKPQFQKGGKFERAYPLFEAAETFMFTSEETTQGKVHVRDSLDSKRMMSMVVFSLIPCTLFAFYNTGLQRYLAMGKDITSILPLMLDGLIAFLPIYIVTLSVGGTFEAIFATVRKHEINEGFLVTSLLYPLILPPTMPLWQVGVGIAFGVVIGKEVFGGTGMNILNPALTARAFLFFAYPAKISGEYVWTFVDRSKEVWIDGVTGATPLAIAAMAKSSGVIEALQAQGYTWSKCFTGLIPGSIGETSTLACLIGALILIVTKVGSWRTMAGCVLGAFAISTTFNLLATPSSNPMLTIPFHWHVVMGGFAFGTVFMTTDPVSSAATKTGKWIYGFCIGVLAILIRTVNPAYPEGMMLAILFMNVFAPLIDHFVAEANIRRRLARAVR